MVVSGTDERSWPTRPAEWNVEPEVSSSRSTRSTSGSPSRARWKAIDVPPTPPPMTTTRARSGSSRGRGIAQPAFESGIGGGRGQATEVLGGVGGEVEVQVADRRLYDAPQRLAHVGHRAHQAQGREAPRRARLVPVGRQQGAVVGVGEAVVDRQVAQ